MVTKTDCMILVFFGIFWSVNEQTTRSIYRGKAEQKPVKSDIQVDK